MMKLSSFGFFAGTAMLALSGSAYAVDHQPADPKLFYLGIVGGYQWPQDFSVGDGFRLNLPNSGSFGAVAGAKLNDYLRLEIEGVYSGSVGGTERCTDPAVKCANTDFDMDSLSILGNAWLDIPVDVMLTPYVGGGIGVAHTDLSTALGNSSGWGLTYQLGAGVRVPFAESFALDLGYRYRVNDISQSIFQDVGLAAVSRSGNSAEHVLEAAFTFSF